MKLLKMRRVLFCLLVVVLVAAVSCGDSGKVRKYKEKSAPIAENPPQAGPTPTPAAAAPMHAHFQWETPAGWGEKRTPTGFRIATFTVKSGEKESTCTIIPLQGEAGGLKANVTRWLGQITNTMNPHENTVEKLLKAQDKFLSKGQFPVVLIDFTPVTPSPTDQSFLVSVITIQGNSVFVKMSGEKSQLIENKEKFKKLCQSFTFTAMGK